MRCWWLLVCLILTACSDERGSAGASAEFEEISPDRELIPAEWTVREDTTTTGEVTTASVQLPASKDIAGLMADEAPRLTLRCMNGEVAVFIDTEPSDTGIEPDSSSALRLVPIQLDSAPSCE